MPEPTPLEACEFLWQASRKAPIPADAHISCQLCLAVLKKVLTPPEQDPVGEEEPSE